MCPRCQSVLGRSAAAVPLSVPLLQSCGAPRRRLRDKTRWASAQQQWRRCFAAAGSELVWPGRAREQRVVRRSKGLGEVAAMVWLPDFGGLGGRWGAEVLVLEPGRVAFEGEDLGMVHESVDHRGDEDVVTEDLASSSSSRPSRLASARRATHSVAVANRIRWPARQARIPIAIARCVLPVPGE